ncbi:44313_t:CDS:2, partial [Gigaspora margarita]
QEQAVQQEKLIQDINNILIQMDNNKLQQVYQIIVQPINNKKINQTTLYQRGPSEGNFLLPFLQNKALNFINSFLYKVGQNTDSLIQKNKALQKQVIQLELTNAKKSHKVRQLIRTLSQYELKQHYHISK